MTDVPKFSVQAREHFPAATIEGLELGQAYVHCPDCDGDRTIYAYRKLDDSSSGDYFNCPCCSAMGEADAEKALELIRDWELQHDCEVEEAA